MLIKCLKNRKAHGLDEITNEMLKVSVRIFGHLLVKLCNIVLETEVVPDDWCEGYILPLYKKGDIFERENYRGITISGCISKLFTMIMKYRLVSFLEDNNIVVSEQIGFCKGHRTADHMFILKTLIDSYKKKNKPGFACFVDLRKAFDSVWREGLIYKLHQNGISTKLINILDNVYGNLRAVVKWDNMLSASFPVCIGTRQGCNLSPSLFNLFVNDILQNLAAVKECKPPKLDSR